MKASIKLIKGVLVFLIIGIGYLNYSMYYQPKFTTVQNYQYNQEVYYQLNFLKRKLRNGAGIQMQDLFPEGFIFINSLYGLTWVNLIQDIDKNTDIYKEGIKEVSWAFEQVNSPYGKELFDENLPLEYGAFYRGWSNYLLGSKLKIQANNTRDQKDIALFKENCRQIAITLKESQSPFPESYESQCWPADVTIAVASLNIHDRVFNPEFQTDIKNWVISVRQKLDTETGLIPHSVNAINGKTIQGARGSSQSLILNFLFEIDEEFSKEQFQLYEKLFLDSRFGLPGIREYPKGNKGFSDIDSGPVILGIGGSASIVGQRTMGKFSHRDVYQGLRNSIEAFGIAYTSNLEKKFILGKLPMADAFIAWSNSIEKNRNDLKNTSNWRIKFQLLSLLVISLRIYFIRIK